MFKKFGKALVIFECYEVANVLNEKTLIFENEGIFINRSNINHKPLIKVYGDGDCYFKVNGQEIKIKNLKEHLIIDCYNMDCYKEIETNRIQNCNNNMYGDFVEFNPGENIINTFNCIIEVIG